MPENNFAQYHAYLKGRSLTGYLYRRFFLYPQLTRHLHGKVLDIGCGIGDMLKFRRGTTGVDINPLNVEECRKSGLEAHVMEVDVLPFEGGVFNGAVLDNVLEHIANPGPLLSEVWRVLSNNGVLICGVPGEKGYASDPDHKVFYDEEALISLLHDAGFEKKHIFFMPWRSKLLNETMRQYCLYGVFGKAAKDISYPR